MFVNPFKKIDMNRAKRSSNVLKQSQEQTKVIDTRLKICIIVVCLLFSVIAGRLVMLQVVQQAEYNDKMLAYTAKKQTFSSPRGTITDRNGVVLTKSDNALTIAYYPLDSVSNAQEWDLAKSIVTDLGLQATAITDRQIKDMHLRYKNEVDNDDLTSLLTKKQLAKIEEGNTKADTIEDWKREKINVDEIDTYTRAFYQVKMLMDSGVSSQYKAIVENATTEQLSYISENNAKYPGFKALFDYQRVTTDEGKSVSSILGKVSTQTQGVPSEEQDAYLAQGYSLNDRVGISGIEKQYESYLSGTKTVYNIKKDEDGNAYLEEEQAGKSGYDLSLTLDIGFQQKCDEILRKALESGKGNAYRQYFESIYLVAMNPNTGEIYAMSGMNKDKDGTIYSNPTGSYLTQDRVGSSVKVATLYMGLNEGAVSSGEVIMDEPMNIKGTQTIGSFRNYGLINGVDAIAKSSNVYMFNIAIRLGGSRYVSGQALGIKDGFSTFKLMRSYYNMFGLGVKTGLDLPNEQIGSIGSDEETGKLLHYAIGQYDTYTTMQLAQYVATVANGGKRIQPHLLRQVTEVNDPTTIIYKPLTTILNMVYGNLAYLNDGKAGMRGCVTSGNCGPLGDANVGVAMASKTGTAENEIYINGQQIVTSNATQIAYGPTENPEIVFACSAPNSNTGVGNDVQQNICGVVIGEASKEYFANHRQ